MILKMHNDKDVLIISGVRYAHTYRVNEGNYVEIRLDGDWSIDSWLLIGPSYLLNDDGTVLCELPYCGIDKREPLAGKCKEPVVQMAKNMYTHDIKIEYIGSYVSPQDIDMRRKITETIYAMLEKNEGKGGERWCLK
ncbi:hypothetical protein [Lacrimispora sp.]|uniref:hypothetical protein n=1 Tax=Lacrimispora sp. TaxID=2719234 RepID=UPI00345F248C